MTNVITLPKKEDQVWVCKCGCYTFELRGDGKAVCAGCRVEPTDGDGLGWWRPKREGDQEVDPNMRPTASVVSNVENYTRHAMEHRVKDPTITWVVCGRDDGSVHSWKVHPAEDGSPDRNRWLLRRLKDAARLLLDQNLQRR